MTIQQRKKDHIELCLNKDVDSVRRDFWDHITLPHCACPDVSLAEISLETVFLNQTYQAPLLISSMTGGTSEGLQINLRLAELSATAQIPMGVGSQRIAIEDSKHFSDFSILKNQHPKSRLWANLGLVQLNHGVEASDVLRICESIEAEALILHLNPLQEALQKDGDTNFQGLLKKFTQLRSQLSIPMILKETGCGIDTLTAKNFLNAGIDAIDVAGMGGTHWGYIESLRQDGNSHLGEWFRNWGIPTPQALLSLRQENPKAQLIASGGLRNGVDAAKAFYLGADLVGFAKPYLQAAANGCETLEAFHLSVEEALKVSIFCTNHKSIDELKTSSHTIRSLPNV